MTVVAEAMDGEDAVQLSQQLNPQLVLMDIDMPRLDGLQATRRLKAEHPRTLIIILSAVGGQAYHDAALKYGADGFLTKDAPISQVLTAIRQAPLHHNISAVAHFGRNPK